MQSDNLKYILAIVACLLFSAYFSATETAFSSLNKTRLRVTAEKGNRSAALALSLSERYDKLISTILIGNNIVNILAASLGTILFTRIYGDAGATISTVVITVVVLIFGEISPKSIAKDSPERFAMVSAPFIRVLIVIFTPLNFLFSQWKKLLSRIFRGKKNDKMSQEELLLLVDEAQQGGGIDKDEGSLLKNAIEFTDRKAEEILTHRTEIEAVPVTAEYDEVDRAFSESQYSRLPVYDGDLDNIVGILYEKDFYAASRTEKKPIRELLKPALFVHKSEKVSQLLKIFQKQKTHLAVVLDEYGGTLGIVSLEDVLEELVGEIYDEYDEAVEFLHPVDENTTEVECAMDAEDFFEKFGISDDESESVSLGGWVTERLGHIPKEGEVFRYGPLTVTVKNAEPRRVLRVLVTRESEKDPEKKQN